MAMKLTERPVLQITSQPTFFDDNPKIDKTLVERVYARRQMVTDDLETGGPGDCQVLDPDGNVMPGKRKTIMQVATELGIEY